MARGLPPGLPESLLESGHESQLSCSEVSPALCALDGTGSKLLDPLGEAILQMRMARRGDY